MYNWEDSFSQRVTLTRGEEGSPAVPPSPESQSCLRARVNKRTFHFATINGPYPLKRPLRLSLKIHPRVTHAPRAHIPIPHSTIQRTPRSSTATGAGYVDRNTNLTNHEKSRSYLLPCYHCITRPQPTASETLKPEAAQEGDNLVTKGVDLIRTREVKLLVEPGHHTSAVYDSHSPRAHLRGAGRFWRWANSTPSKASASPGVTSLVRG